VGELLGGASLAKALFKGAKVLREAAMLSLVELARPALVPLHQALFAHEVRGEVARQELNEDVKLGLAIAAINRFDQAIDVGVAGPPSGREPPEG